MPAGRLALPRCSWCKGAFVPIARGQLYCTHSHRQMAYEGRRKAGEPVDATMRARRMLAPDIAAKPESGQR